MSCESKSEVPSYFSQVKYFGGYGGGDPPLPIPNREVKPAIADGTAPPGGRVGSCRSSTTRLTYVSRVFLSKNGSDASRPSIGGRIPRTPCVASLRCFFDVLFFCSRPLRKPSLPAPTSPSLPAPTGNLFPACSERRPITSGVTKTDRVGRDENRSSRA